MDTNVPTVESGEDVTMPFEGNTMSRPEAPESSDVALFKQKMAQMNPTLNTATSATSLPTKQEPAESLIDLSQKFKDFLEKNTYSVYGQSAVPTFDKKTPLLQKGQPSQAGATLDKTNTYAVKDVPTKEANLSIHSAGILEKTTEGISKNAKFEHSETSPDLLKKEFATVQDNAYVTPIGTPLISHSDSIQGSSVVETHAAMISQQIKDQVIDRILVSANDIAANKIVKVVINPTVLEATEVNFQKIGDALSVQFASKNQGSLQFLQVNQADLQGYLQNGLKQFKEVTVSIKADGSNPNTPEDGRSRNRYEYQSLDEDEQ